MKDLVISISKIFDREDIKFVLIGALARDLYFEEKNITLEIGTKDIDFAILAQDWKEFNQVKDLLKNEMGMTEDTKVIYRLMYGGVPIDLLPFGKIAEPSACSFSPDCYQFLGLYSHMAATT
jgi:predicted nucleotidyltransferase